MDIEFAFICDYAEVVGKINALGIGFDRINAVKLPVRHPHFHVVAQVRFSLTEVGSKDMSIHLIDADGDNVVPPIQGTVEVANPPPGSLYARGRINLGFGNVEFKKYGEHSVRINIQGTEVVSIPFSIAEPPATS